MRSKDSDQLSRRQVVGGLGVGLAAATVTGSATIASAGPPRAAGAASVGKPHNPVTQYPRPPFPAQQQPWPGLVSKMTPRPDHGEKSYRGSGRLAGRMALITGGDSGIGRATAIAFAREGAHVAINYLPVEESDAQEVIALIRAEGRKGVAIPGDIRDEAFCKKLVAAAVEQLGGLDILVNNAARQQYSRSIIDLTTEDFDATFKTNVYAMFWITKAAMPHLSAGTSIINTASMQAIDPSANLLDYSQTKAAIIAFSKSLAKQVAAKGIRVNAITPGAFWTPIQTTGGRPPEEQPKLGGDSAFGRAGQPVEIAPLYVMLASAESSYCSGEVLGASGGGARK